MTKQKAVPAQKRKAPAARKPAPKTIAKAAKVAPTVFAENTAEIQQKAAVRGKPFQPGQSGNPAGKPKGARHKLTQDFLRVLAADFNLHGKQVLEELRKENGAAYIKAVTSILPKIIETEDEDGNSTGQVAGVLLVTKSRITDLISAQ
jgi:hypothetical protein